MRATSDRAHSSPLIQIKPHSPPGPLSRLEGVYEGKAKRARDVRQPVMQDRDDEQEGDLDQDADLRDTARDRVVALLADDAKAWRPS
jgi:hypothetical protein